MGKCRRKESSAEEAPSTLVLLAKLENCKVGL